MFRIFLQEVQPAVLSLWQLFQFIHHCKLLGFRASSCCQAGRVEKQCKASLQRRAMRLDAISLQKSSEHTVPFETGSCLSSTKRQLLASIYLPVEPIVVEPTVVSYKLPKLCLSLLFGTGVEGWEKPIQTNSAYQNRMLKVLRATAASTHINTMCAPAFWRRYSHDMLSIRRCAKKFGAKAH